MSSIQEPTYASLFIRTADEASIVVRAARGGLLPLFSRPPASLNKIEAGNVFIWQRSEALWEWKDARRWALISCRVVPVAASRVRHEIYWEVVARPLSGLIKHAYTTNLDGAAVQCQLIAYIHQTPQKNHTLDRLEMVKKPLGFVMYLAEIQRVLKEIHKYRKNAKAMINKQRANTHEELTLPPLGVPREVYSSLDKEVLERFRLGL